MIRELTIASVIHPEYIDGEWMYVTHPALRPIPDGAPDIGWEGDNRLAIYLHLPSQTFVLWRLEHDDEYRPVMTFEDNMAFSPDAVNAVCRRLIEIDGRNGFNPGLEVITTMDKAEAELNRVEMDRLGAVADKLLYGLSKSHLAGWDIPYQHNLLAKGS